MSVPNVMVIHPVVVEIFQCGAKHWTDQHTNIAIHRATPQAWLKIRKIKKSLAAISGFALMHGADQTVLCNESILIRSLLVVSLRDL